MLVLVKLLIKFRKVAERTSVSQSAERNKKAAHSPNGCSAWAGLQHVLDVCINVLAVPVAEALRVRNNLRRTRPLPIVCPELLEGELRALVPNEVHEA